MTPEAQALEELKLLEIPDSEMPEEDGIPLDTNWHRMEIGILVESLRQHWAGRKDFFVGGNMFIYFSAQQVKNRDFKGPDFFVVKGVADGTVDRGKWVVWREEGLTPHVVVELLSPSTRDEDLGPKKRVYEEKLRTPDYFCYDPDRSELQGFRLRELRYTPLVPDGRGFLWCEELGLWLGPWRGTYLDIEATWLRFHAPDGALVPTPAEAERARADAERTRADAERTRAEAERARADAERTRAEAERGRAEAAEAELALLRARLGRDPGSSS